MFLGVMSIQKIEAVHLWKMISGSMTLQMKNGPALAAIRLYIIFDLFIYSKMVVPS
jgi:hypothetical protein